jgi:uncharacterized Zn finger protein
VIFTSCPTCDFPQAFVLERGRGRWLASRCRECGQVMWVEMVSIGGVTLDTEALLERAPAADHVEIRGIETEAVDCSTIG